jgi:hypothetical protein
MKCNNEIKASNKSLKDFLLNHLSKYLLRFNSVEKTHLKNLLILMDDLDQI